MSTDALAPAISATTKHLNTPRVVKITGWSMKLTLAEPKYLKDSVMIISELVNEARFKISKEAIELVAMDPANVAMVIFKLLSSCFVEYNVEQDMNIAINLGNLKLIMRRAKPSDTLTLELEQNKLKIILKGGSTRTFSLPIIDLEEKEQKVPELKFASTISTQSDLLSDAIEDVDIVGESVGFSCEQGLFTVEASGDLSNAQIEMRESKDTKIKCLESSKAKYSIEYLKKMMSASKLADTVELHFSNDYPLKLEYKVIDKMLLSFILAPRVENE